MTRRIVQVLDALTALVLLLLVWVLLTDGFTLALGQLRVPVTRGQDVLLVALGLAAVRWSIAVPSIRPERPARVVAIGLRARERVVPRHELDRRVAVRWLRGRDDADVLGTARQGEALRRRVGPVGRGLRTDPLARGRLAA